MKAKLRTAIEHLLIYPDATVAEMLGVRLSTLRGWMKEESFIEALRARERDQARAARRLATQSVVRSAARLCEIVTDPKSDAKVLVDLLKVSGVFQAEEVDPGAALAEVIRSIQEEED